MAAEEPAVDRAAMARAADQVEGAVSVLREVRSSVSGYSFALQRGWTGQAASAFNGAYEAFSAELTEVMDALQAIREQLVLAPEGR
jgi:WXG100 family type VII secretion target